MTPLFRFACLVIATLSPLSFSYPATPFPGFIEVGKEGKQIVALVRQAQRDAGFSGAILAAKQGKIIAAVAVGNSGNQPLDVTTLFELASCTKPFTAIAVMKLVEEGKLKLDDPIADYLLGIPEDCNAITVRHLLQHTSGISGTNSEGRGNDLAEVLPKFLAGGPQSNPGTHYEYWNQGYALLSEIIARSSGKTYTSYMRQAIFKPCKMESSRFNGDSRPRGVKVAVGVSTHGKNRTALEHPYGEYGLQYRGMGGLVTSLVDLWRWDRTLAADKLIKPESYAEMTTPGPSGYALGWRVHEEEGHSVHEHTGSVRGFLASLRRVPDTGSCLFILANSDDNKPFGIVKRACEDALAGKDAHLDLPDSLDLKLIDSLVGTYRDATGNTLTVTRKGATAAASINWDGPVSAGHLNQGEDDDLIFEMAGSKNEISVERDPQGKVSALTITDLESPIKFVRE